MEKVKLPREVSESLKSLHREGFSNYAIIGMLYTPHKHTELADIQTIDKHLGLEGMHPDDLIKAMVNGYEVEETREDAIRRSFEMAVHNMKVESEGNYDSYSWWDGRRTGIIDTLNALGKKIEGVNT